MKILVTGASGFIGSFIVERALELGFEVWAGVRASSSRRWLTDARIRFIDLDLSDEGRLQRSLETFKAEGGVWDYVVHAAGATKAKNRDGFMAVNRDGTVRLVTALAQMQMVPKKLVFLSSLSVLGAIHETDYAPLTSLDTPQPNTAYGQSKLAAETFLRQQGDVPCIVLRPTGVYGPREHDYFLMAKSICQHVDFAVGYKRQDITFIYVKDLVEAVFQALEHGVPGQNYLLSDGKVYDSRDFSDLLQKYLGVKRVLHLRAPLWVLRAVCGVSGWWAKKTGKTSTLNNDKYHILKQRNWRCDIAPACEELGYVPRYDLEAGVRETVAWYKQEQWI